MFKFAVPCALGFACSLCCAQGANDDVEAWLAVTGRDGVQRVNIRCGADFFDPGHIIVKANVPVQLSVSTTPTLPPHNFIINLSGPKAINAINANTRLRESQVPFTFVHGVPGDYLLSCRDSASPSFAPAEKTKQGVLTVIP